MLHLPKQWICDNIWNLKRLSKMLNKVQKSESAVYSSVAHIRDNFFNFRSGACLIK